MKLFGYMIALSANSFLLHSSQAIIKELRKLLGVNTKFGKRDCIMGFVQVENCSC